MAIDIYDTLYFVMKPISALGKLFSFFGSIKMNTFNIYRMSLTSKFVTCPIRN